MKKLIFLFVILFVGVGGLAYVYFASPSPTHLGTAEIRGRKIALEIADTIALRTLGLSGRNEILEGQGMLFVFPEPDMHGFWMKDMNFPIDIIWIRGEEIVGFSENAQPEPGKGTLELQLYYPPRDVDKVLEMKAGSVKSGGFQVGDSIRFVF